MIGSWSNGSTIFENKYFQSSLGLLSLISFVRFQRHPMKFNFLRHSVIFFTRSNYIFNNIQFFDEIQLYFWRDSPLVALGKTTHCCFGFLSPEQRFHKNDFVVFVCLQFSSFLFAFVFMFTLWTVRKAAIQKTKRWKSAWTSCWEWLTRFSHETTIALQLPANVWFSTLSLFCCDIFVCLLIFLFVCLLVFLPSMLVPLWYRVEGPFYEFSTRQLFLE